MGPSECHRGGLSPFFVPTSTTSHTGLAVALVLAPLVASAYLSGRPPWRRVAAVGIPTVGIVLGHTRLDRLIVVLPAMLLVAWPPQWVWRWPTLVAAASVAVVAAGARCDHPAVVACDGAAWLGAFAHLLAGPHPPLPVVGSLVEASLISMVLVAEPVQLGDRESHMTWWGLVGLAVFDYARARGVVDSIYITVLALQVAIVIGVWYMSATKCELLADALRDAGGSVYFVGNALMHYWPSFRVLLYRPHQLLHPARQGVAAIGAIAIYTATTDPTVVYGCQAWLSQPVVLGAFGAVVFGVTAVGAICGTFIYPLRESP